MMENSKMSTSKLRLDDILIKDLGQFGLYQKLHYILVGIPSIFAAMHAFAWTFAGAKVDYRCLYPGENATALYKPNDIWFEKAANLTAGYKGCRRIANIHVHDPLPSNNASLQTESCPGYNFAWDHSDIASSAVDRWSLVCDRGIYIAAVQALYFAGQLLGSLVFGLLSDKIGRKPVFIIAILMQMICGSLIAVVPWWGLMAFLRFGTGFGHPGVFIMSVVIGAELVGPKYRVWSSVLAGAFWAVGEMILGALSYPLRDYRYLQLAISLPAIVLVSYWWLVPESSRWLISQGRHNEVDKVLNKVAKWNGKPPLEPNWQKRLDDETPPKLSYVKSFWTLFKTPRLRIRTLITFFLWAVITMCYYGLGINPGFMGGDNRLGFILSGLFEFPGLAFVLLVNWIGRKFMTTFGFLLAALCLSLTLAVPSNMALASLLLVVIGKAALTGVFANLYIWTPEHYPTIIRNTATGSCSMIGRVGGIVASFFSLYLADDYPGAVALTFAGLASAAGLMAMFLPETTGEPLMETIDEAEEFGIEQPYFISGYRNQKMAAERLLRAKPSTMTMQSSQ